MVMLKLEEQPPLIQAIFSGDIDDVRNLLENKPDVNYQDTEKRSPLHAAAFKGDRELAELLIQQGARVNTKDNKWLTPLHRACGVGADETVALLLKYTADIRAKDKQWQTPLHIAAANNSYDCIVHLLNFITNINITDRQGRTALHHAALNGHNEVVELLISKGCIVNACDKRDCRPIHWAAHLGHVETVDLLIRNGADINVKDRNQYTPLHAAAASGMVMVCRYLLNAWADIDAQNAYGNTPLHIACLNGHGHVCKELVEHKANIEAINYRGQSPLHIAAASTHGVACLEYLLKQQNININRQSYDGRTPLHMSAIYGRFTRSQTLIDHGAVIDCQDKNGNTALHIAAQYGHDILTATLLDFGADPNKRGYEGRTPLHVCCLSGFVEVSRKFIQASIDLNTRDDTGKTPIHCAAYQGSVECLDLLVSQGADFKMQDNNGRTALHYAAGHGHYNCVFTLVGIGAPVNVTDKEGCTALHLAADYDKEGRCVEYLLQHRADPKLKDHRGYTPIHYAVNGSNEHALHYLLQALGKDYSFHGCDMPLTTPLHLAARSGNINILCAIIPYFPDTNIKNDSGCTPLLIAAREGQSNCVQMLLRYGAKVSICEDLYNMSPVHYSAKNGHMHCLALLVDNAEDKIIIDKPDKLNRTALMLAVSGSHKECVLTLLKSNSDPNIVDSDKHSSIFRAVVTNQSDVVDLLISKCAQVADADVNGKTVLHLAAACGHLLCLIIILKHMQSHQIAAYDSNQFNALHWACYYGNYQCVDNLLRTGCFKIGDEGNLFSPIHCAVYAGSELCLELLYNNFGSEIIKLRDARQRIPLHIAALHGHVDCAKYLLEQGAAIDAKDDQARTPLIAAAQNGQSHVIELFIAYKTDVKLCDNKGNTALHMACLKKHSQTALLLLECISDQEIVNMTNEEGKTPLHLSARNGLVDVTRELIRKGSSVLVVDTTGLTPALACAPNQNVANCLAIILASHPMMMYPLANHSKQAYTNCKPILNSYKLQQTDISLLRDSRELFDEIVSTRRSAFLQRGGAQLPSIHRTTIQEGKKRTNIVLIEDYDKTLENNNDFHDDDEPHGLNLHRSYSDIALTRSKEERMQLKQLIDRYKAVAKKMNQVSGKFHISHNDINNIYMKQQQQQQLQEEEEEEEEEEQKSTIIVEEKNVYRGELSVDTSSLLTNRHVQFYHDVFKQFQMAGSELQQQNNGIVSRICKPHCTCQYACARCILTNRYDERNENDFYSKSLYLDTRVIINHMQERRMNLIDRAINEPINHFNQIDEFLQNYRNGQKSFLFPINERKEAVVFDLETKYEENDNSLELFHNNITIEEIPEHDVQTDESDRFLSGIGTSNDYNGKLMKQKTTFIGKKLRSRCDENNKFSNSLVTNEQFLQRVINLGMLQDLINSEENQAGSDNEYY